MRVPMTWLRTLVDLPPDLGGRALSDQLIRAGLEVETVETVGAGTTGPLVVGRVASIEELTEFKKPIRFCRVDVGTAHGGLRDIVCGARNFAEGDLVVVALPGAVLPGDFAIAARQTYGHTSDGMICSERELGLGDDHSGIIVLHEDVEPGTDGMALLGLGEEVLDIAVTPDRGYCLSMRGIAREAATANDVAFTDPATPSHESPGVSGPAARVEDPVACPRFTLRSITGFDPSAPTPRWMRSRLVASGMRSVNLAVDVTNYVMLELGQPLHAFDAHRIAGPVTVRRAAAGEKLETLDHVTRTLHPEDLLIADDRGPLGLAGTMGGLTSEVDDTTTDLVLEAAHFDAPTVARMARRHRLSSEASRRFERGVDPALPAAASARAAALLVELGGGTIGELTVIDHPFVADPIPMPADLPSRVSGLPVDVATTIGRLSAIGAVVVVVAEGADLHVTPPSWRPDLTDPADLVEEVLRLGGFDSIPSELPTATPGNGLTEAQRLRRRVMRAITAAGFVEILNAPFIGVPELDALSLPLDDDRRRAALLANPMSDEAPILRTTLLPGLVSAARRNLGRGSDDLALVEAGLVFRLRPGQDPGGVVDPPRPGVADRPDADALATLEALLPDQPRHVAVLLTGNREPAGWWGPARPALWADAIAAARTLADTVGAPLRVAAGVDAPMHPGRCAALLLGSNVIGFAGELHPRVVAATGLPARTAVMELDLDALLAAATPVVRAPAVSTFPVAKEDVALVVADEVSTSAVAEALRVGAGPLLEDLRLFDVYTGPQIGDGRRSLAFNLRFRAPDRTLTPAEVTAARDAAVAAATLRTGATPRT